MACQGQLLSITQNNALFALLGTTYGGNGTTNFPLPDLQGRVAMGQGNGLGLTPRVIGEIDGEENHTILITETPMHTHPLNTAPNASTANNIDTPSAAMVLANATGTGSNVIHPYALTPPAPTVPMAPTAIASTSGGQAHANMMPYLGLRFCIAMSGIFPSRS